MFLRFSSSQSRSLRSVQKSVIELEVALATLPVAEKVSVLNARSVSRTLYLPTTEEDSCKTMDYSDNPYSQGLSPAALVTEFDEGGRDVIVQ
jgi:hypothetical protein